MAYFKNEFRSVLYVDDFEEVQNSTVKDWNCAPTIRGMMDLMIAA